jgi:hypothetical protein
MSNNRDNYWDDDEEDDEGTEPSFTSDTDLVKKLRKALKAEQKKAKELESSYQELTKSQRERIIKDALASKGISMKVAAFVPAEISASDDAINAWLDANADVFGYTTNTQSVVDQSDIKKIQKMDNVLTGADSPTPGDDVESRIANATTPEEILSIIGGL